MRIAAASTLLFATLALASPAPVAQPEPGVAQHMSFEARNAEIIKLVHLEARKKKKLSKIASHSNSNSTDTSPAVMLTPSRVLQAGVLGFGVIEVFRLWG